MSAIISEFFTVFVRNTSGDGIQSPFVPSDSVVPQSSDGTAKRDEDKNIYELGSGNMIELGEGDDITIADSKRPNENFAGFYNAFTEQIGAALEIPYEVLKQKFESSYSASRAALLEAWSFFSTTRFWLVRNLCQPVYTEWLTEAIVKGRISAPGFFDDLIVKQAWCGSEWAGSGMGMIDPKKEIEAVKGRLALSISTHEKEFVALHGANTGDWESMVNRLAREKELLKSKGLVDPEEDLTKDPNGEPVTLESLTDDQ